MYSSIKKTCGSSALISTNSDAASAVYDVCHDKDSSLLDSQDRDDSNPFEGPPSSNSSNHLNDTSSPVPDPSSNTRRQTGKKDILLHRKSGIFLKKEKSLKKTRRFQNEEKRKNGREQSRRGTIRRTTNKTNGEFLAIEKQRQAMFAVYSEHVTGRRFPLQFNSLSNNPSQSNSSPMQEVCKESW